MMLIRKCSQLIAACAVAVTLFVSTPVVSAEELDGSKDIVCAVLHVVACIKDGDCLEGQAKTFDLPALMIVDAENNVLRGTYESGHKAVSPIKNKDS